MVAATLAVPAPGPGLDGEKRDSKFLGLFGLGLGLGYGYGGYGYGYPYGYGYGYGYPYYGYGGKYKPESMKI